MKIVTTTSVFPYDYPCDKALLRLSDIGFKNLDLAMDYCASVKDGPFSSDDWESWAEGLYELAEKNDVKYITNIGCDYKTSKLAVEEAEANENVFAT